MAKIVKVVVLDGTNKKAGEIPNLFLDTYNKLDKLELNEAGAERLLERKTEFQDEVFKLVIKFTASGK